MRTRKSTEMNLPGSATEDQFHGAVAELLDWILAPPAFYTTFPAGYGRLGKATAGRLKAKGMKAGMPDILVFHRLGFDTSRVIGLELKAGRNTTTTQQRATHANLKAAGVTVHTIRTLSEVVAALEAAKIPCRKNNIIPQGAVNLIQESHLS